MRRNVQFKEDVFHRKGMAYVHVSVGALHGKRGGWIEVANHRYAVVAGNTLRPDNSFTETTGYGRESLREYLAFEKGMQNERGLRGRYWWNTYCTSTFN